MGAFAKLQNAAREGELAALEKNDVPGKGKYSGGVVAGEDGRFTQRAHQIGEFATENRIERRERFVEQKRMSLRGERAREGETLLFAAAQLARVSIGIRKRQLDLRQELRDIRLSAAGQKQMLRRRSMRKQPEGLRYEPDRTTQTVYISVTYVLSFNDDRA